MNRLRPRWFIALVVLAALIGMALILFYQPERSRPVSQSSIIRTADTAPPMDPPPAASDAEVGETDWLTLMPPEDIAALENLSPVEHLGGDTGGSYGLGSVAAAQGLDVFSSFSTVTAMNHQPVKLGGFIVPLSANESNELVEFFLVPYFGACLHTPPPPPNQIVHVVLPKPIPMTDLWTGYWVEGDLKIKLFLNEVGGSAYQIADAKVTPWS